MLAVSLFCSFCYLYQNMLRVPTSASPLRITRHYSRLAGGDDSCHGGGDVPEQLSCDAAAHCLAMLICRSFRAPLMSVPASAVGDYCCVHRGTCLRAGVVLLSAGIRSPDVRLRLHAFATAPCGP